jgi:hypothetical protein
MFAAFSMFQRSHRLVGEYSRSYRREYVLQHSLRTIPHYLEVLEERAGFIALPEQLRWCRIEVRIRTSQFGRIVKNNRE